MEASKSDSALQGMLRKIDTFSMPFQFSISGLEKTNKTFVGGFFTLIVYSLSIAYFIYITKLYFTTGYQPKVSTIDLSQNNDSFQVIDDSFAFNFFVQDQGNIQKYEKQTGKKYFSFLIYYQYYDTNENLKNTILNTIKCSDPNLQEYLCIDFGSLPSQVTLKYNQAYSNLNQEGFQIIFLHCSGDQNCADDQDQESVLYSAYNRVQFSSKLERFNTLSQNVETVRQINSYILDQQMGTRHQIRLVQSKTTLIEGFILQKRSINNYLDSFEEVQEIKLIKSLQQQAKIPVLGEIIISMSTKQRFITIQYPLFTETFAQFMSVFALLTILGHIGKIFSEIEIYQELSNLYLKHYYQQTAIKAYKQFITHEEQQEEKELQTLASQTGNNAQKITNFNSKISKIFFPKKIYQILNFSFFQKIQILLKKEIPAKFLDKKPSQLKQIHHIIKNTHKYINLAEFYKDIIQIKLIIRLLLTKEQFSAIKYCGLDIQKIKQQKQQEQTEQHMYDQQNNADKVEFNNQKSNIEKQQSNLKLNQVELQIDKPNQKIIVNSQLIQNTLKEEASVSSSIQNKTNCLNHLEQIEKIDQSNDLAEQYFTSYLKQIEEKENITDLDLRILNCLIHTQDELEQDQEINLQQQ
ncbi:hypothetical protein ABPG72_009634 [Tetrahymena utriculariae]